MNKKKNLRKYYSDILIFFLIFLIDRITKFYIINLAKVTGNSEIYISEYLNIYLIWNDGVAFGLFSFDQTNAYNILSIIILIVISVIFFMIIKSQGLKKISLIMIFAGALGNFFDRIFFKSVPDFIDFHIGNFHWFVFNVADVFISLGVILMVFNELFVKDNTYKNYEKS